MKIKLQDIQKDKAGQYIILAWEKKYVTPKRMSNIPSKENEGANIAVRSAEEIVNGRDNAVQAWAGTAYRTAEAAPEDKPNLLEATKENINEMRTENYPIFKAEREARFAVPRRTINLNFGKTELTPEEVAKKAAKLAFPKRRLTIN